MGDTYLAFNGLVLFLFISICLHHRAFYKRFEHSVRKLDQMEQNVDIVKRNLREIIQFHNSVKG